jgi:hypothetical protein
VLRKAFSDAEQEKLSWLEIAMHSGRFEESKQVERVHHSWNYGTIPGGRVLWR